MSGEKLVVNVEVIQSSEIKANGLPIVLRSSETDLLDANIPFPNTESLVSDLIKTRKDSVKEAYVLKWFGNKTPRGAIVGGHEIDWTQHGEVHSKSSGKIGTYERLVEFGGENKNFHCIVVFPYVAFPDVDLSKE